MTDKLNLETEALRDSLADLSKLADGFGRSMVNAFAHAIVDGRKFSDVLKDLAQQLVQSAFTAGIRPLGNLVGSLFSGVAAPPPAAPAQQNKPASVNVTVNIATPDVQSFQRSQSQVAAMMARAVSRGARNL